MNELPDRKRAGPGDMNSDPHLKPPDPKQPKMVEIKLPDTSTSSEKGENRRTNKQTNNPFVLLDGKGKPTKGGGSKVREEDSKDSHQEGGGQQDKEPL